MKPITSVAETNIKIVTTLTVDGDGLIEVTTVVLSHGNAFHRTLGTLLHDTDGWFVTNREGQTLLFADTKGEALKAFAGSATAQAAKWAVR